MPDDHWLLGGGAEGARGVLSAIASFDQIRHFGQDNPALLEKVPDAVTTLSALAPLDRRRPLDELAAGLRTDLEGERS